MRVREARPDEWPAIRDLRLRALREDETAFGHTHALASARTDDDWRRYAAARPGDATFVAEAEDGRLVGMARGHMTADPRVADLYGMWVAPEARGRGAGRRLLDAVAGWARAQGALRLVLWVAEDRPEARALYARAGFVETGARDAMPHHPGVRIREMVLAMEDSSADSSRGPSLPAP